MSKIKKIMFFISLIIPFILTSCQKVFVDDPSDNDQNDQTVDTDYDMTKTLTVEMTDYSDFNELFFKKEVSKNENNLITSFIHILDEEWYKIKDNQLNFDIICNTYDSKKIKYEINSDVSKIDTSKVKIIKGSDQLSFGTKEEVNENDIFQQYSIVDINGQSSGEKFEIIENTVKYDKQGIYKYILECSNSEGVAFQKEIVVEIKQQYSVIFKLNPNDEEVLYEDIVFKNENAEYKGKLPFKEEDIYASYEFIGWSENLNNITSDLNVYATFKEVKKQINVTFAFNGKTSEISLYVGDLLTFEQIIIEDGYEIEGVYLDSNFETPFNFDTEIYENTTLYLKVKVIEQILTIKTVDCFGDEKVINTINYTIENMYKISDILENKPLLDGQEYYKYENKNNEFKMYYRAIEYRITITAKIKIFELNLKEVDTTKIFNVTFTKFNNLEKLEEIKNTIKNNIFTKLDYSGDKYFTYDFTELETYLRNEEYLSITTLNVICENKTQTVKLYNTTNEDTNYGASYSEYSFGKGNYIIQDLLDNEETTKPDNFTITFDLSYIILNNSKNSIPLYVYYFENSKAIFDAIETLTSKNSSTITQELYNSLGKTVIRKKKISVAIENDLTNGNLDSFYEYLNDQTILFRINSMDLTGISKAIYFNGYTKIDKIININLDVQEYIFKNLSSEFTIKDDLLYSLINTYDYTRTIDMVIAENLTSIAYAIGLPQNFYPLYSYEPRTPQNFSTYDYEAYVIGRTKNYIAKKNYFVSFFDLAMFSRGTYNDSINDRLLGNESYLVVKEEYENNKYKIIHSGYGDKFEEFSIYQSLFNDKEQNIFVYSYNQSYNNDSITYNSVFENMLITVTLGNFN